MKKITLIVRVLMGLVFLGSGIAFFFVTPPPMEGPIVTFFQGMMATKYMIPLIKGTEILAGLLLILGMYVPLAIVALAPVVLNIFLLHAFIAPDGVVLGAILGAFEIYLAFFSPEYSPVIKQLFKKRA